MSFESKECLASFDFESDESILKFLFHLTVPGDKLDLKLFEGQAQG